MRALSMRVASALGEAGAGIAGTLSGAVGAGAANAIFGGQGGVVGEIGRNGVVGKIGAIGPLLRLRALTMRVASGTVLRLRARAYPCTK